MKKIWGRHHHLWVVFCMVSLSFSLLLIRVSSTSSPTLNTDHGDTDSTAGRTLRQEQGGNHEIHCSRERSRAAWKIIEESQRKCLADVCGALHCDLIVYSGSKKSKCNPAAAARNKHLCESLADSCFPLSEGLAAGRLHEFFLRQFCDAHTCTGSQKPFSRGRRKKMNVLYLVVSILIVMLLILFYLYVYLYRRGMKRGTQVLRRISQTNRKKKPF